MLETRVCVCVCVYSLERKAGLIRCQENTFPIGVAYYIGVDNSSNFPRAKQ